MEFHLRAKDKQKCFHAKPKTVTTSQYWRIRESISFIRVDNEIDTKTRHSRRIFAMDFPKIVDISGQYP